MKGTQHFIGIQWIPFLSPVKMLRPLYSLANAVVWVFLWGALCSPASALETKYRSKRDSAVRSYVSALASFASQAAAANDRIHYRAALRRILLVDPGNKQSAAAAASFDAMPAYALAREKGGTPKAVFDRDAAALVKIEHDFAMKLAAAARSAGAAGDGAARTELLREAFRHAPYSMNVAKELALKWNQAFAWVEQSVYDQLAHSTWTCLNGKPVKVEAFSENVAEMKAFFSQVAPDVQKYRDIMGQRVYGISDVTDNTLEERIVFQLTMESRDLLIALGIPPLEGGIIRLVLVRDKNEYARFLAFFKVPGAVIEKSGGVFLHGPNILFTFQTSLGGGLEKTIFHEAAHALVASVFPRAPRWLHESIATLSQTARVEVTKDALGVNSFFVMKPPPSQTRQEALNCLRLGSFSVKAMIEQDDAFLNKQMYAYSTAEALGWTLYYSGVLPELFADMLAGAAPLDALSVRLAAPKDKIDAALAESMAYLPSE